MPEPEDQPGPPGEVRSNQGSKSGSKESLDIYIPQANCQRVLTIKDRLSYMDEKDREDEEKMVNEAVENINRINSFEEINWREPFPQTTEV